MAIRSSLTLISLSLALSATAATNTIESLPALSVFHGNANLLLSLPDGGYGQQRKGSVTNTIHNGAAFYNSLRLYSGVLETPDGVHVVGKGPLVQHALNVTTLSANFSNILSGDANTGILRFYMKAYGDGGGLTNIVKDLLPWANMLFVDLTSGNDATGVRADPQNPFETPGAAQAVAQVGDTIVVMPGEYAVTNLGKDYVNWYLQPNAYLMSYDAPAFLLTNITCQLWGPGAFTNFYATNAVLVLTNSTIEFAGNLGGGVVAGGTNAVTFRDARISTPSGLWLRAEDTNTTVYFWNATAAGAPTTAARLSGSLRVAVNNE